MSKRDVQAGGQRFWNAVTLTAVTFLAFLFFALVFAALTGTELSRARWLVAYGIASLFLVVGVERTS